MCRCSSVLNGYIVEQASNFCETLAALFAICVLFLANELLCQIIYILHGVKHRIGIFWPIKDAVLQLLQLCVGLLVLAVLQMERTIECL